MRKLKPADQYHRLNVDFAVKHGPLHALVFGYIHHWISVNEKNADNYRDGYAWTYFTPQQATEHLPYLTKRQIERILKELREKKILKTGNYNKAGFDRTLWYTISDPSFYVDALIHSRKRVNGNT